MYLRNAWYCAGWSATVAQQQLVGRTFLGESVLLYRTTDGTPVALSGRCPHRFAPLHKGRLIDDAVECPYHGLVYGPSGKCIANPHGDGSVPKKAALRRYPLEEQDGVLWIWMGDPERIDSAPSVDSRFLVSDEYTTVFGYLRVGAHYQLVIDNLLDLTHPAVLHRGGLSSEEYSGEKMEHNFRQEGVRIHSEYTFRDVNASPQLKPLWGERKSDVRAFMSLSAPSNLSLDFRMNEVNGPLDEGLLMPSLHLLVPENETSTHYYYAMGRNVELGNRELTDLMGEMMKRAFVDEDEPMISACQEMMGTTDLFSLKPVILKTDVAAVRARLLIDNLIAKEAGTRSAVEDPPEAGASASAAS